MVPGQRLAENVKIFIHLLIREREEGFPELHDFVFLRVDIAAGQTVDAAAFLRKCFFDFRYLFFIHVCILC